MTEDISEIVVGINVTNENPMPEGVVHPTIAKLEMHGNLTVHNKFDCVKDVGDTLAKMTTKEKVILNEYLRSFCDLEVCFGGGRPIFEK
jgi:hypothetical protein